jgi:hypothetical protein
VVAAAASIGPLMLRQKAGRRPVANVTVRRLALVRAAVADAPLERERLVGRFRVAPAA